MADTGIPVASPEPEGSPDSVLADSEIPRHTTATEEVVDHASQAQRRVSAVGDVSYHPGVGLIPIFAPPRQRQKWGDTQVLPRTNWGDIFFDLWFVAVAYNVGNIIVASPTGTGLLYFIGTFLPLIIKWQEKTYYDSRYAVDDDLFHRFFEVAVLLVVSTAVVHVRPVEFMSNPAKYDDMFLFSLALALGSVLSMYRYVETYFFGKGQIEVSKQSSIRDIRHMLIPFTFYIAATVISGIQYYSNDGGITNSNTNATEASTYSDGHRFMAEATGASYVSQSDETTNIPIILCLCGVIALHAMQCFTVIFLFPNDGSHKKYTIPMNVDFQIHRDGEWIMLMLGESILSLLIVDAPEGSGYYLTFYTGVLTVILLQYLHFRSQPHHADDHSLRRDKNAAMVWRIVFLVYSAALVCVGVSYKLFMYEFTYEDQSRRLAGGVGSFLFGRVLAGGGGSSLSTQERRQGSANVFCISMALVWFCQDFMLFLHCGFSKMKGKCYCKHSHKLKVKAAIFVTLRAALLGFIASLSQYETDPEHLALYGLAGVIGQLILRVLGNVVFPEEQVHHEESAIEEVDPEENKWPNVTHAVAESIENGKPVED